MITSKLLQEILSDKYYKTCIHKQKETGVECSGRITLEHAWIYSGKQIQEKWAIVPCCWYHHLGKGLEKNYNRYTALKRANLSELAKRYPKKNWRQEIIYLESVYGKRN